MPKRFEFEDYDPLFRTPGNRGGEAIVEEPWPVRSGSPEPEVPFQNDSPFGNQSKPPKTKSLIKPESTVRLILKRGHVISYAGLFLFTIVLYFRPYELFTALSWMDKVAYWLAIATIIIFLPSQLVLEGNLTARPRVVILVLLLTLAGLISMITAINPLEAWNEFNDVFIKAVLMFIVMINVVRTELRLKALLYVALAVTFVLSFNAIRDYQTANFAVEGYRIKGLLGGMFGNPNDLALHFVTMTPIAVTMALVTRSFILKVLLFITAILIVAGNVVTYSRGGFLGLLVVAVVLGWKIGRKRRLLLAIVGPVILGVFILLMPGGYGIRLLSIFIPGLDPVGSSGSRQEILNRSILVSLRNPLSGIGMGNFHTVSLHETVTHNAFTQVSAELGFGALIVYLMFLTAPILWLRKVERETSGAPKESMYYYLSIGLQASLIGYMVSAFFAAVAYQWYAYYLVAYGVCLVRLYQNKMTSDVTAVASAHA
ncbi:MAG TPA: O-antigen ligase family protein [Pyrinomonadaceae bacterium]|nr:O-antigen ligase family protein [Pyrinomonadaceae bacterium]